MGFLSEEDVRTIFARRHAVITGTHVVYTSGRHGAEYVNKDAVSPYPVTCGHLCAELAQRCQDEGTEFILAPAIGAVILAQWLAMNLSQITGREVVAVYAEKVVAAEVQLKGIQERALQLLGTKDASGIMSTLRTFRDFVKSLNALPKLEDSFVIKRGFPDLIRGKRGVVVEDVLTTGGTVTKVLAAAKPLDCNITSVCGLVNRGGVTAEVLGVPLLHTTLDVQMDSWPEEDCPLCQQGVPINTEVGKGADFLARKGVSATAQFS